MDTIHIEDDLLAVQININLSDKIEGITTIMQEKLGKFPA